MVNVEKLDKGRLIFIWVGGGVIKQNIVCSQTDWLINKRLMTGRGDITGICTIGSDLETPSRYLCVSMRHLISTSWPALALTSSCSSAVGVLRGIECSGRGSCIFLMCSGSSWTGGEL